MAVAAVQEVLGQEGDTVGSSTAEVLEQAVLADTAAERQDMSAERQDTAEQAVLALLTTGQRQAAEGTAEESSTVLRPVERPEATTVALPEVPVPVDTAEEETRTAAPLTLATT